MYIARRLVRMAIEDVGLADPRALGAVRRGQGGGAFSGNPGRRSGAGAGGDLDEEAKKINPREQFRRVVQGDLSSVRVVLGLVLIAVIFQVQESRFLSAENLTNLMLQITTIGLISVGIVYVLLLGEIDLSVGAVSGWPER